MTVQLLLCVNHGRNGEPTGHIEALEIIDVIHLEAPHPSPIGYVSRRRLRVRVAGRTYRILGWQPWAGSWTWDMVTVSDADAIDILDRLRKTGRWSIDEAEHTVYEKWRRGEKILAEDLRTDDA